MRLVSDIVNKAQFFIPSPQRGEGRGEGVLNSQWCVCLKRDNINAARLLRKNQTEAENKLWSFLRNRGLCGVKFRRQFPLNGYVLDFYAPEYKICVEADGGQHYLEDGMEDDEARSKKLGQTGIRVLRFSNIDILTNIEGVGTVILNAIDCIKKTPSPYSSPQRGEETKAKL